MVDFDDLSTARFLEPLVLESTFFSNFNYWWAVEFQLRWITTFPRQSESSTYICITFIWLGVPQKHPTAAASSQLERHLTVFCMALNAVSEIVKVESHFDSDRPGLNHNLACFFEFWGLIRITGFHFFTIEHFWIYAGIIMQVLLERWIISSKGVHPNYHS